MSVWCSGGLYTAASTNLNRDLSCALDSVTLHYIKQFNSLNLLNFH